MPQLILMRHGATEANLVRPYTIQGREPDSELAAIGVEQARAASAALRGLAIARVYSSPLKRARATAAEIANRLGLQHEIEAGLIEADVGQWAGLTWQEIEHRWPEAFAAFQEQADVHGYLGGENLNAVRDRVLPVMEELFARHPEECVLVVGHGVLNRVLLAHWLGLPLRLARRLPCENTGFSRIDVEEGQARVRSMNESAHLARTCRAA